MNRQHLLESVSGVLWNIYIDENSHLVYSKKQTSSWSGALPLDNFKTKFFSATIDMDEKVHIVAYTSSKQLIYYQWNGSRWLYSILTSIQSRFQELGFLKTLSSTDQIHILYHIKSTVSKSSSKVYHYYGDGFDWQGGKITSLPLEETISIIDMQWYDQEQISLYYSQEKEDKTAVYKLPFNKGKLSWGRPRNIFDISNPLKEIEILLDSKKREHAIGVDTGDNIYSLYYLSHDRQLIIDSQPRPFSTPMITKLDGNIHVIWNVGNDRFSAILDKEKGKFHSMRNFDISDMSPIYHVTVNADGYSKSNSSWADMLSYDDMAKKLKLSYHLKSDEIELIQRSIDTLKTHIANIESQFDELYSLYHSLHEHIVQYEKSLYQVQLSIKKHSSDITQLQNRPQADTKPRSINYSIPYEDSDSDNKTLEGEVIQLGDTKIVVNNEESDTDDS